MNSPTPAQPVQGEPVAWRVRGYNQFKTGTPGPWRYFDGRPDVNGPDCCDIEPLYAAPSPQGGQPAQQGEACNDDNPVVGHKTFIDETGRYSHEPLRQDEAQALIASADAAKAKRATDMPTEEVAAAVMWSAHQRLKELGWKETCYGPTNVTVRLIQPGSSGIHQGSRHEEWPSKTWWIEDHGDIWPSNPCLFKPLPAPPEGTKE